MQVKETERALVRALQCIGEARGREVTRALVRALDARVPSLPPSLIEPAFSVADLDSFARGEGVSVRRDNDGEGRLLSRVRDAMFIPSLPRLVALARAWDPGGDPWTDIAQSAQQPLFAWWETADDPRALAVLLCEADRFARGRPAKVCARVALELAASLSSWRDVGVDVERVREQALAALDAGSDDDEGARFNLSFLRQSAVAIDRFTQLDPYADGVLIAPALALALRLVLGDEPAHELAASAIQCTERDAERMDNYGRSSPRDRAKRRADIQRQWALALRTGGACPELAQWVAQCPQRPRG
jgi:hypothetical protein